MPDLGIVIVNYNTREDLNVCLRSIQHSTGGLTTQVVVVDNCSSDGSVDMVRTAHPWVSRLIACERNGGYAHANNIGLRALGYGAEAPQQSLPRYALLLNPDTVLPANALSAMVAFMEANSEVGVAGPKLVRQDGSLDRACRRSFPSPGVVLCHVSGLGRLFPHSPRLARYNLIYLDPDVRADVDAVVGAFMLLRAQALEQAGLLDEAFFMYGEDIDLCYRIKQRGWRVVYNPEVTVLHIKGAASRKTSRRSIIAFYDAMSIFHNKHYRAATFPLLNWGIDLAVPLLRQSALLRDRLRSPDQKHVGSA